MYIICDSKIIIHFNDWKSFQSLKYPIHGIIHDIHGNQASIHPLILGISFPYIMSFEICLNLLKFDISFVNIYAFFEYALKLILEIDNCTYAIKNYFLIWLISNDTFPFGQISEMCCRHILSTSHCISSN